MMKSIYEYVPYIIIEFFYIDILFTLGDLSII